MKKQDLVPQLEVYQFQRYKIYKGEADVVGVVDKTRPYYKLKTLEKAEGMMFEQLNMERHIAQSERDAQKSYETSIDLCNLVVDECVNDALKPEELNHKDCYHLLMSCITVNLISETEEKK